MLSSPLLSQSWVFAWLDTGKSRYAVYALVYLLPYFRSLLFALLSSSCAQLSLSDDSIAFSTTSFGQLCSSNLSISPEDSWLPITSILLGILHVQVSDS